MPLGIRLCRAHYDKAKRAPPVPRSESNQCSCPQPPTGRHSTTLLPCPKRLLSVFRAMWDTPSPPICTSCNNTADRTEIYTSHRDYAPPVKETQAFKIPSKIYVKSGTKNRTRFVEIDQLAKKFGQAASKALVGLHAFTGCDTVSSFAGRGKITPLKSLLKSKDTQRIFSQLGESWVPYDELLRKIECFTKSNITAFMDTYREESRTVSIKMHILEHHVVPCIRRWGFGLGLLAGQGIEKLHSHFNSLGRSTRSIPDPVARLKSTLNNHLLTVCPDHVSPNFNRTNPGADTHKANKYGCLHSQTQAVIAYLARDFKRAVTKHGRTTANSFQAVSTLMIS
ncbi:hypothetical protein Bbelb_082440 [Branchiostoma belcheri]|nr:hypothetical protein Bbelb_082440 [Branchiostoma belcheri]